MAIRRAGKPEEGDRVVNLRNKKTKMRIKLLIRQRKSKKIKKINVKRVASRKRKLAKAQRNLT